MLEDAKLSATPSTLQISELSCLLDVGNEAYP